MLDPAGRRAHARGRNRVFLAGLVLAGLGRFEVAVPERETVTE